MKHNFRYLSLKQKMICFSTFLTCLIIVFFLLIWGGNQYLFQQQDRLLKVQQHFSTLVYGLGETDSALYAYAQKSTDELKDKCNATLEDVTDASGQLSKLLERPIFVDLTYLVKAYANATEQLLSARSLETGRLLSMYHACAEHLAVIDSLMHEYNLAVDNDRFQRQQQLVKIQKTITQIMIGACIALLGTCALFFHSFSRHIIQRIVRLTAQAEKISRGDWNAAMPEQSEAQDEVGILAKAFYHMLEVILRQIEQLKQQEAIELHLKEAEVAAANMKARMEHAQLCTLQSRVNPHFLFNTLNVIAGQAAEEAAPTTMDMLLETADYLRYSLNKLDKVVTVKEELQNVENYFQIQKRRFADRIKFSIDYEEAAANAKIPSMILQPLCENALIHGVMPLKSGGTICLHTEIQDNRIQVAVSDNGAGFTPERLREILKRLEDKDYDDTQGIGLYNILHRLMACFHEDVEYDITSTPCMETKVMLRFPAVITEEEGDMLNDKGNFS